MSCFAVLNLKWPSLLQYEEEKRSCGLKKPQKSLSYSKSSSDTYMRKRLDEIDPDLLR